MPLEYVIHTYIFTVLCDQCAVAEPYSPQWLSGSVAQWLRAEQGDCASRPVCGLLDDVHAISPPIYLPF